MTAIELVTVGSAIELESLTATAYQYAVASRAPATLRAYASDWRDFTGWCSERAMSPLPAAPETVALYLTALAAVRATATLQRRLTSISQYHQMAGYDTPTTSAVVRTTWKGIRRTLGTAQVGKAPIRTADLRRMVGTLNMSEPIGVRDRALLVIGFSGAFRRSELVALNVDDITEGADGLTVLIRRSKTDQESRGETIGLPYGSDSATCPVRTLRAWVTLAGITDGAIFRAIDRHGNVSDRRLGARAVAERVKRAALAIGLDPALYAGHSLRAGLITSAAEADVPERRIMAHSRHKSVLIMRRYIRNVGLFDSNAAAAVGL